MDIDKENTINFDWDCEFLSKSKKDYSNLIKLFDEYKLDGNASIRILDFLENETN
jgi:hypothetical protein